MRCEKCNVEITCKADRCPLCHTPLRSQGEVAFPKPDTRRAHPGKFTLIYLIVAVVVNAICITLNVYFGTKFLWSVMVLVVSVYVYHFINIVLITKPRWHRNVLGQILILTAIFIVIRLTIGGNHWIFIAWLPALYMASDILMIVFMIKQGRESPKYIAMFLFICLLGVVPTICAYAFDLSVKIPSIVATCVGGVMFVSAIIIWRKTILYELSKAFHA